MKSILRVMNDGRIKTTTMALYAGLISLIIGLVSFAISWNFWDLRGGPMPGIQVLLFPGNLTLIYVWHPLFTEEMNFWPKLALHMFGQFFVVTFITMLCVSLVRKLVRVFAS
ncbi:hypothetical protein [Idiomarina ramblicola]|uniref:Uncharacterized protein n=1 Tax=Idiomarina ramblicola TaxID=263724 RepID=A0A432YZP7_9GAMM|nr:hypothetical protein [Idiomarina ramblicola]RUO69400.1 hypothetical protein CWI78_05650 [Idiomarina ramblicola]